MLGSIFTNAGHMRRFMRPDTKYQALYNHFLHVTFGLFWGGRGAIVESACGTLVVDSLVEEDQAASRSRATLSME